jgi:hypothetical protein
MSSAAREELLKLATSISKERLRTYESQQQNLALSIDLYHWNIVLSQSAYLPLHILEITLRNHVDQCIRREKGGQWLLQNVDWLLDYDRSSIKQAITKLQGRLDSVSHSDVVPSLSLGFWVGLFDARYDNIWRTNIFRAFPNLPKGRDRQDIQKKCKNINYFRNRIAHYEPIFKRTLRLDYENMTTMLDWICPTTRNWLHGKCIFLSNLRGFYSYCTSNNIVLDYTRKIHY